MEYAVTILPIVISLVALFVSIKAIRIQIPTIKIIISDPQTNCFYGATKLRTDGNNIMLSQFVAVSTLKISNTSSAPITISNIHLQYTGTKYDLADKNNEFWKEIEIYFEDKYGLSEDKTGYTTDGSYVDYAESGILVPFELGAYDTKQITCVFHSFPRLDSPKIKAKICVETACGKAKRKIVLHKYDADFTTSEWKEIEKFNKSY